MISTMKRSERWKDVVGYEGLYQVSDCGRIKSLDRIVPDKRTGPKKLKGRILRPGTTGSYLVVGLCKDGIQTTVRVHRLVAEAWLGPCPDGMEVCHGPNGQMDNSVSNLRYDTYVNNALDRREHGKYGGRPVRRSDGVEYISLAVAAEETGCRHQYISLVCNGKRKTTGGYSWEYI